MPRHLRSDGPARLQAQRARGDRGVIVGRACAVGRGGRAFFQTVAAPRAPLPAKPLPQTKASPCP